MIKLVASDVDGTLIPEGHHELNPELISVIRQLKEKGIIFAAASGRQYISAKHLFREVESDIYFLVNNGAQVCYQGDTLELKSIPEKTAQEIVRYLRTQEDTFYILTTADRDVTDCKDEKMMRWLIEGYRLAVDVVDDVLEIHEPFLKIAIFYKNVDSFEMLEPAKERFGSEVAIMASGAHWLDFVNKTALKGIALSDIQKRLGITKEETMAFGDNDNDISLLQAAEESYAVSEARESVKAISRHVLPDTTEETVLRVLRTLL